MSAPQKKFGLWLSLAGYAVLMAGVVGGLLWVKQAVLTQYSTQEAIDNWQVWREDVIKAQKSPSPVERRVPKSLEPPALVLMRDYFVVSMAGAVFFTSLLYWIGAWLVAGALRTSK